MMRNLLKFSKLVLPSFRRLALFARGSVESGASNRLLRALAVGSGMALGLGFVCSIEDEAIRNLRSLMMREINTLRTEYGQTTIYP